MTSFLQFSTEDTISNDDGADRVTGSVWLLAGTLALAGAVGPVAAAAQETFMPPPRLDPAPTAIEGATLDIFGVVPGMTVDEARAALLEHFPEDALDMRESSLEYRDDGVTVEAGPVVSGIIARSTADSAEEDVAVALSGPASGNQVISVIRETSYPDDMNAPTVAEYRAELEAHFGPVSGAMANVIFWIYADGALVPCELCPSGNIAGYAPGMLDRYAEEAPDHDFVIRAGYFTHSGGERVEMSQLSSGDHALRHEAAMADLQALVDEHARVAAGR